MQLKMEQYCWDWILYLRDVCWGSPSLLYIKGICSVPAKQILIETVFDHQIMYLEKIQFN